MAEPDAPLDQEAGETDELLLAYDRLARAQLAFTAPQFLLDAARWAAERMYRGCQLLVFRRLDAEAVKSMLGVSCPRPLSAEAIYSADLALRYVGDLITMARAVAQRDELVAELLRIGHEWPLSSIGVTRIAADKLNATAVEMIMCDRCLRQLYIDRVIARREVSRLEHLGVREGVRAALGMYDDLWPEAAALCRGRDLISFNR